MRYWFGFAAVLLGFAAGAAGDEVLLKNGNVIHGTIVSEDAENIVFRIPFEEKEAGKEARFVEMTFPRSRVQRLTRSATVFTPVQREAGAKPEAGAAAGDTPAGTGSAAVESASAPAKGDEETAPGGTEEVSPALKAQIDALLEQLKGTEDEARTEAEQKLGAIGEPAMRLVGLTLKSSESRLQSMACIRVLRAAGDRKAVRVLIDKLEGANQDRARMQLAWNALKSITGQTIYFNEEHSARERGVQKGKWLEWFETVKDDPSYRKQYGFSEQDEKEKKEKQQAEAKPAEEAGAPAAETPAP